MELDVKIIQKKEKYLSIRLAYEYDDTYLTSQELFIKNTDQPFNESYDVKYDNDDIVEGFLFPINPDIPFKEYFYFFEHKLLEKSSIDINIIDEYQTINAEYIQFQRRRKLEAIQTKIDEDNNKGHRMILSPSFFSQGGIIQGGGFPNMTGEVIFNSGNTSMNNNMSYDTLIKMLKGLE